MAHKSSGGSTQNVHDSPGQRLGIKRFGGELVWPGCVIVRQRGTKYFPGHGVRMGRDFTIYATTTGCVQFSGYKKVYVNVEPLGGEG